MIKLECLIDSYRIVWCSEAVVTRVVVVRIENNQKLIRRRYNGRRISLDLSHIHYKTRSRSAVINL